MHPVNPRTATMVLVIRTALLFGLLLFGGVTWYLERQGSLQAVAPEQARVLGYVFMALVASALGGLFFFRAQLAHAADSARQLTIYLSGYALAEGTALFGAVIWFLGGQREWYIAGLVLMVVAFQILPVKR